MLSWYSSLLTRRPLTTKVLTSTFIAIAGDCTQQHIELYYENKMSLSPSLSKSTPLSSTSIASSLPFPFPHPHYDYLRTFRMACWGGLYIGPVFHYWFRALDRAIPASLSPFSSVLMKLSLDQLFMAPVTCVSFFTMMGILEGRDGKGIIQKINTSLYDTLVLNYTIWPASQLVNFVFVPLQYRVLMLNIVGFGWNIILSKVNAEGKKKEEAMKGVNIDTIKGKVEELGKEKRK